MMNFWISLYVVIVITLAGSAIDGVEISRIGSVEQQTKPNKDDTMTQDYTQPAFAEAIHITVATALINYFTLNGQYVYDQIHEALAETFPTLSTYQVWQLIKANSPT